MVTFVLVFSRGSYWNCSNKTQTPIPTCIGIVDAIRGPKILFLYIYQGSSQALTIKLTTKQ